MREEAAQRRRRICFFEDNAPTHDAGLVGVDETMENQLKPVEIASSPVARGARIVA
jgi:hypothetical protein